jgi:sporulation protein YlmC with PRC-barrel domain
MKAKSRLLTAAAAIGIAASTAAPGAPPANVVEPVPDRESVAEGKAFGNLLKASDLIGMSVERGNRKSVGKVEDIVVGLETGRAVAIIVALNENNTLRAVPPGVLHYDLLQKVIHLKTTPEKVALAPVLERPTWKKSLAPEKLAALYRHYDAEPPFAVSGKGTKNSPPPLGTTEMATKLDGAPVKNLKSEQIGQVQNCMVDLSTGRIPFVVIATGEFIGKKDALSPVPAQAMNYDKGRAMLVLDVDRETLARMPHFKATAWPNITKGSYLADIYAAYGVKPDEATTLAPAPGTTAR